MTRGCVIFCALIFAAMAAISANAETAEQIRHGMENMLRDGACRANMPTFPDYNYNSCGDQNAVGPAVWWNCSNEIDKLNQTINRWNDFVRQCREKDRERAQRELAERERRQTKKTPPPCIDDDDDNDLLGDNLPERCPGSQKKNQEPEIKPQPKQAQGGQWRCFGEHGNVYEGFMQCKAACSRFYDNGFCHRQCYASGNTSVQNGRSCFKEP